MTRRALPLLISLGFILAGCSDDDGGSPTNGSVRPNGGNGAGNGSSSGNGSNSGSPGDPGDNTLDFTDPTGPAPTLAPELLALTYVGAEGDQFATGVSEAQDGTVAVTGADWTYRVDLTGATAGAIEGDIASTSEAPGRRPSLPGSPGRAYEDPRIGLTFTVGFRQAGGNLQIPIFRAFDGDERIWILWGHAGADVEAASLGADSRCYQA
ncbi:MAG: hypothetical protein AAGA56_10745, partial [Myxococcota bacterium]